MAFSQLDKLPLISLEPKSNQVSLNLAELLEYRHLILIFASRDVRARYKQTLAGMTWVVVQPLISMVVFSVFFGHWLGVSAGDAPYPVFTFCALVPWTYFVHAITMSTGSIVLNAHIITKVYFPRLVLPLGAVTGGLVDILTSLIVLVPLLLFYGISPGSKVLALPLFVFIAAASAFSFGVWLAAFNVRFRDVRQALPFFTQLWMFCTPVAYPLSVVPEPWRFLYFLNPMTTVVEGFRWTLGSGGPPPIIMVATSLAVLASIGISGCYWFRREESHFADVI